MKKQAEKAKLIVTGRNGVRPEGICAICSEASEIKRKDVMNIGPMLNLYPIVWAEPRMML